jgi:threonine dehydratase
MLEPTPLDDIEAARERISESALRTPLVRLNVDDSPAEIYLKLENLQPIGSFKIRGATNAMALAGPEALRDGVYTASAGNMGQGVGWAARKLGIPFSVVVPDHAPDTKLAAIERLGGRIIKVTFEEWWQVVVSHQFPALSGWFIHPVSDPAVIAGHATIGLELLEDLPDVDAVVVPYGGGGLSSGIASAVKALRPELPVYGAEVATAAPLAAAFEAGEPTEVVYQASFVDGIGSSRVLEEMWPLVSHLLAGSLVAELDTVEDTVRLLLERNRIVTEGAGAISVAVALQGAAGTGKVACIVSGGNIDRHTLSRILSKPS